MTDLYVIKKYWIHQSRNTSIINMSSSNAPSNNFEEDSTKDEHPEDGCSPSGQGRKLTPLPLSNPGAKPGQNQVSSIGWLKSYSARGFFFPK